MTDPGIEPVEPAPEPVRRRHRALLLAAGLAIVVGLIGVALYVAPTSLWNTPPRPDADAALAARLGRLEAAQNARAQAADAAKTADEAALGKLDQRLRALETRPLPSPPDLSGIQQQIAALGARIDALDKIVRAQPASDPTDAALALIALQIGDAINTGRPFAAEYQALAGLTRDRPELAGAAAPLAEPAKTGVAVRAVLARELRALAGRAAIAPPPAEEDWSDVILARLRGLVTIRRIDGAGQGPVEAAYGNAEKAMAQGDLAGAVQALQVLPGIAADTARPWLQMATARLQVEDALHRLTTLLAARLGKPAATQPAPG